MYSLTYCVCVCVCLYTRLCACTSVCVCVCVCETSYGFGGLYSRVCVCVCVLDCTLYTVSRGGRQLIGLQSCYVAILSAEQCFKSSQLTTSHSLVILQAEALPTLRSHNLLHPIALILISFGCRPGLYLCVCVCVCVRVHVYCVCVSACFNAVYLKYLPS